MYNDEGGIAVAGSARHAAASSTNGFNSEPEVKKQLIKRILPKGHQRLEEIVERLSSEELDLLNIKDLEDNSTPNTEQLIAFLQLTELINTSFEEFIRGSANKITKRDRIEGGINVFLTILSVIPYIGPSLKAGSDIFWKIILLIAGVTTNATLTAFSTLEVFHYIKALKLSPALQTILPEPKHVPLKISGMVLGGLLTSFPFAGVAFSDPPPIINPTIDRPAAAAATVAGLFPLMAYATEQTVSALTPNKRTPLATACVEHLNEMLLIALEKRLEVIPNLDGKKGLALIDALYKQGLDHKNGIIRRKINPNFEKGVKIFTGALGALLAGIGWAGYWYNLYDLFVAGATASLGMSSTSAIALSATGTTLIMALPILLSFIGGYKMFSAITETLFDLYRGGPKSGNYMQQVQLKKTLPFLAMLAPAAFFSFGTSYELAKMIPYFGRYLAIPAAAGTDAFNALGFFPLSKKFIKLLAAHSSDKNTRDTVFLANGMETLVSIIKKAAPEKLDEVFNSSPIGVQTSLLAGKTAAQFWSSEAQETRVVKEATPLLSYSSAQKFGSGSPARIVEVSPGIIRKQRHYGIA